MYSDFYGFARSPFQLTPDPAFYWESVSHRQALSYLSHGMAQGEGFVVITGEAGTGKSTLAAHLMASIDPDRLTVAQLVSGHFDGDEMLQIVARAFGLATTPVPAAEGHAPTALEAIERFLHEEARAGRRCLLVVDEAQNLPIAALEDLRLLANFQLGAHPLLQILLIGQPKFRSRLQRHPAMEQLRQRVIASHHLDPLEPGEVEHYIQHRLSCVGWIGRPSFASALYAGLYAASGGVPQRINQIVNRLLLRAAAERRDHLDGDMLSLVLEDMTADGSLHPPGLFEAEILGVDTAPLTDFAGKHFYDEAHSALPAPATRAYRDAGDPRLDRPVGKAELDAALARRDAQIGELQQAVLRLAEAAGVPGRADLPHASVAQQGSDLAGLQERIANLEHHAIEQERAIRHTLAMVIEWIERDGTQSVAA